MPLLLEGSFLAALSLTPGTVLTCRMPSLYMWGVNESLPQAGILLISEIRNTYRYKDVQGSSLKYLHVCTVNKCSLRSAILLS